MESCIPEYLPPQANLIELLEDDVWIKLQAHPQNLMDFIDVKKSKTVVIDEIQRIPELLNEIHRLIEKEKLIFILPDQVQGN